ncbi:thiamine phosphate synthase [Desulforhopalus singaporensis]|uniref:Thiamine-phosphate synthase n=1 Tax=Desulforhopalus singaporensis TaxID=91360 RepID=A0A1H0Q894_9BACT|nr:thiamine phosphate synthase [Desulforhopalus singaporensis]SDP13602.1 thiamine-phosphate pyrophosphorylase [Desulforhopalus singaporensis]
MTDNKPSLPQGIYGITAEKFSRGRSNTEVVRAMIDGGVTTVQYREKRHLKDYREILDECYAIREITRDSGVVFIVNDFVDIALLVDADGVHVGQEDLGVKEVRKLLGPDKIIGLSTHSPEQVAGAEEAGADYIGVGPIYATRTKENVVDPVGLEYLEYVATNCPLPFAAIGGIKEHNITEVVKRGAKTVCLVTEIVGADDISKTVTSLAKAMLS